MHFCCDTGIQHGWRGYWSFYIGLPYDDFSIAVYSNQGCCYEIFAKYRKKVMDEFILDSEKYSSWFGDTVGGVKEVKLFDILDNKHREFDENKG